MQRMQKNLTRFAQDVGADFADSVPAFSHAGHHGTANVSSRLAFFRRSFVGSFNRPPSFARQHKPFWMAASMRMLGSILVQVAAPGLARAGTTALAPIGYVKTINGQA